MNWLIATTELPTSGWLTVAIIAVLIAALGVYLDTILHDRHKTKVQETLLEFWDRLNRNHVPDLPRLMAESTLRLAD